MMIVCEDVIPNVAYSKRRSFVRVMVFGFIKELEPSVAALFDGSMVPLFDGSIIPCFHYSMVPSDNGFIMQL